MLLSSFLMINKEIRGVEKEVEVTAKKINKCSLFSVSACCTHEVITKTILNRN